jgi:hypothetical protein
MKTTSETFTPFVESEVPLIWSQEFATRHCIDPHEHGGHPSGLYFSCNCSVTSLSYPRVNLQSGRFPFEIPD